MMDIYNPIAEHIRPGDEFLIVYSALHNLGFKSTEIKWQLLQVLRRVCEEGITVLVPSFTFSFTEKKEINLEEQNSEVGILGDWSRSLSGAVRTCHPIYSFVVNGTESDYIKQNDLSTCFGIGSVFDLLENRKTRILMLGVGWESCTNFHYYEEKYQVPYRFFKKFSGKVQCKNKLIETATQMYVRDLEVAVQNDFARAVDFLWAKDKIRISLNEIKIKRDKVNVK